MKRKAPLGAAALQRDGEHVSLTRKTITIAAVLAATALMQDGAAQAANRDREWLHHATAAQVGVYRGYRHYAHTAHRRLAGRVAIRSPRAAGTFRNYVATAGGGMQVGRASFYSGANRTANGGFVGAATCAHRSLPFGTKVLVTNLANARQAILTVNDRGPFVRGRVLDVSRGAAGILGMLHAGVSQIRMQVLGSAG